MLLNVLSNGDIRFIYNEDMDEMVKREGQATITRASHVEPVGTQWQADMSPVGGPILGPFELRSAALAAEVKWLEDNYLS